ncbi:major facilitator superfamily transporter [Microdochium trichocladiopsis]|uniref:Major facilitator superfamily transporter n=1 Tax=Microdochium trichocladiopsis TaxID=1682393 RepID=A0A9P8XV17_9PEZI|nr:major facilitator superfamily transporter [Microdochium trichocladiopsis]KAH7020971.1 major facilitator superfamily transporter [Microdochium trichocladiopsis]
MDETAPLLPEDTRVYEARRHSIDDVSAANKDFVQFDPEGDAENPMDWPAPYKWTIVALLASMAFTVTFTCISVVPIASRIIADLEGEGSNPSKSSSVLLVTIWELGEAAGPLFIAPLSEAYGRYPVVNIANMLFIGTVVLAALATSSETMILSRCLTGVAVISNVLNPAIVGDMFPPEQRGTAMSLIQLAPLTGGAIGPAIAGAIAETAGWRTILWISVGLATACEVLFLTLFRETYQVPILRRKAARLRKETGNNALRTVFDADDGLSSTKKVLEGAMRPLVVFCGSGVLQAMSLFGSVVFAFFYIMSTTLPDILQDLYKLSPAMTGLSFVPFSVGSVVSVIICNRILDPIYVRLRDANGGVGRPEFRLPVVIAGSFSLPLAILLYGIVAQARLPLPVLLFSVGLMGGTLLLGFLPVMNYFVDAFGLYSASAITAIIVTRCIMGTFLPLLALPLIDALGYGGGFAVLAGILLAMAPIPMLVMRYGGKWRQRSKYTRDA